MRLGRRRRRMGKHLQCQRVSMDHYNQFLVTSWEGPGGRGDVPFLSDILIDWVIGQRGVKTRQWLADEKIQTNTIYASKDVGQRW